jgi:hypothetical protein
MGGENPFERFAFAKHHKRSRASVTAGEDSSTPKAAPSPKRAKTKTTENSPKGGGGSMITAAGRAGEAALQSFGAIVSLSRPPHTLLVGTFPSVQSLQVWSGWCCHPFGEVELFLSPLPQESQYFGNPNNAFWWIVGLCCRPELSAHFLEIMGGDGLGFCRGGRPATQPRRPIAVPQP